MEHINGGNGYGAGGCARGYNCRSNGKSDRDVDGVTIIEWVIDSNLVH